MRASEMQALGWILIVLGLSVIAVAQIILALWLKKSKRNLQEEQK